MSPRFARVRAAWHRLVRREPAPGTACLEILGDTLERAERRVLAELLALPASELWARFGRDAESWTVLEPVLSARLLVAAQQRARAGVAGAEPLAWLVVLRASQLPAGSLAESLQRDFLAEALLVLAELALAAGDAGTTRRRLRLAKTFAATGSGSQRLSGELERTFALFRWAADERTEALFSLERAASAYRAAHDRQGEAEAQLWLALVASELGQPEASRQAWAEASRLLGAEVDAVSVGVLARWRRVVGAGRFKNTKEVLS
jgi:hypothetical protein